jgi:hypothetical protein
MERCAFVIEDSDRQGTTERLSCLLNPNTLVFRRLAGLRPRHSLAGALTQQALTDDPLIQTGGGTTELRLDLLFDVNLPGTAVSMRSAVPNPNDAPDVESNAAPSDVRDLTRPLWNLAENRSRSGQVPGPPRVRFVWGKAWDFPAMVVAIAERMECFTPEGVPQRSFVRLRLLRADERIAPEESASSAGADLETFAAPLEDEPLSPLDVLPPDEMPVPEEYESYVSPGGPMYLTALLRLGDVSGWRKLAELNPDIDPVFVPPGTVLRLPASGAATQSSLGMG